MTTSSSKDLTTLVYDGSWNGLLNCVFYSFEYRLQRVRISLRSHFSPEAFDQAIVISNDDQKARRVWTGLTRYMTEKALAELYKAHLSELPAIGHHLFWYIKQVFDRKQSMQQAYGNEHVLKVHQTARMVHREKHRMEAFVRFRRCVDNLYYATIEPDFNILPLICGHFSKRYADQKWLIYDLKRNYGIHYDLNTVTEVLFTEEAHLLNTPVISLNESEIFYQHLWTSYFNHVNITERKNLRLHLRHVPRRYWKYLTEKQRG